MTIKLKKKKYKHIPKADWEGKYWGRSSEPYLCSCGIWYDGRKHNICPECMS